MRRRLFSLLVVWGVICSLGGVETVQAATECKATYVFHRHEGFGTTDQAPVSVMLSTGQSQNFNQGHMVRIKNTGTNKVKVTLTGVLITPVTINPGSQDPGVGFYVDLPGQPPPTLTRIECLAYAGTGFGTPQQLIETLKATVPVEEIARQLKAQFLKTEIEIAGLLKPYFTPQQVMNALKVAFNATVQQVAQWMQAAGYTAEQIAWALNDAGVNSETIVRILKALGYSVLVVAVILLILPVFVLTLGASVIPTVAACVVLAVALIAGGYPEVDAARAIKHVGGNEITIAGALKQLPVPARRISPILASLGYSADQIIRALQTAGFTAEEIGSSPGPPRPSPLTSLSEQPVSRPSLQQPPHSKLIPPRPFTVNKETMDHLARTPLKAPNSLTGQEHQVLRGIAEQIKAHDTKSATNGWSTLVTTLNRKSNPVDINELVQYVLREAYLDLNQDLQFYANKVKRFNEEKKRVRSEIADLRDQLARLCAGKPKPPSGKPPHPPDPDAVKCASLAKSLKQLEEKSSKAGEDAQLADIDMQNALQKQQQTLQMMSQISKMLHDTAMAVIRKIGG